MTGSRYRMQMTFFGTLFTHLEAWVTPSTGECAAAAAAPTHPSAAASRSTWDVPVAVLLYG